MSSLVSDDIVHSMHIHITDATSTAYAPSMVKRLFIPVGKLMVRVIFVAKTFKFIAGIWPQYSVRRAHHRHFVTSRY